MGKLNFFQFTILFSLISLCMIQCTDIDDSDVLSTGEIDVELRRDPTLAGPGTYDPTDHYGECSNVNFSVQSAMYNPVENVICCNYSTEENLLEISAYGVGLSDNLEWNIQGANVLATFDATVITDIPCPIVGQCSWLSFEIIDHGNQCKSTFITEICNNSGPCFISNISDCADGESYWDCFCRQNPSLHVCDDGL